MHTTRSHPLARSLALVATATLLVACADSAPVAPDRQAASAAPLANSAAAERGKVLATLRRVTARYHRLDAAIADGFVFLHGCEVRPGEGPVGMLYVHMGRLLDGVIDPELPDALLYAPTRNGRARLVGVELAIPYVLWAGQQPPELLDAEFQPEDEFGVWALHAWVWRHNPDGMFAESNPRVSCGAE